MPPTTIVLTAEQWDAFFKSWVMLGEFLERGAPGVDLAAAFTAAHQDPSHAARARIPAPGR